VVEEVEEEEEGGGEEEKGGGEEEKAPGVPRKFAGSLDVYYERGVRRPKSSIKNFDDWDVYWLNFEQIAAVGSGRRNLA